MSNGDFHSRRSKRLLALLFKVNLAFDPCCLEIARSSNVHERRWRIPVIITDIFTVGYVFLDSLPFVEKCVIE